MFKKDFLGKELNIGDKVVWANREPRGNKKDGTVAGFYVGTITKLCNQQAKVTRDDGLETKQFYELLIKIDG